ncbi:MAG: GFA family protein [Rhodocyclales bacterium]|nr:GFA family protein [Rhodocyclales bacterium]
MIEGSCLCGGIRYQYDGEIEEVSICHCSQCRKAQGSAFAAVSPIGSAGFKLVAGAELLKEFRATPGKARVFCANCGSPIYSAKDDLPEVKRLRLGTVDTPFVCDNIYHIFVGSKASWLDFNDTHPRFAERKP